MKKIEILASKSDAQRALIAAGLSEEPCRVIIRNDSRDVKATMECMDAIRRGIREPGRMIRLSCRESGATFRFLIPVVAALGLHGAFFPEGRLSRRPLSPLYEELTGHGAVLSAQGSCPFIVKGPLKAGDYHLPGNVSSQFVSGLLFALPLMDSDSRIFLVGDRQSMGYIDMTLNTLRNFGITVRTEDQGSQLVYHVPGGQKYHRENDYTAEGDWSNAAFWLIMGVLGKEPVEVSGLSEESHQGDRQISQLLREMGARIETGADHVIAYPSRDRLHGITIDASQIPDMVPALSAVAAAAEGETRIIHAERLRLKESDRLQSIHLTLSHFGADIRETADELVIHGGLPLHGADAVGFNDHRIVMMEAALSLITEGKIVIRGADAVRKSYPEFFQHMKELGLDKNLETIYTKGYREMGLDEYRNQIDEIDKDLIRKLDERMRVAEKIAKYKEENGLAIVDPLRESLLLDKITDDSASDMAMYNRMLFQTIMELSSDHQRSVTNMEAGVVKDIRAALEKTPKVFPETAVVACQGVQGAYSQEACERFFKLPTIIYTKNFRGVFSAIESGLCRYGVLPIENSTAGSVNQVYDLMREYDFHIVKSIRVKVNHCLLANPGVRKTDIKEIISHEQAISQCEGYIHREFPDAVITRSENTAQAAKNLAESGRKDAAVIGSQANGEYYSLDCLDESIQDNDNNYTRFVCITRPLEIYPGANKTSFVCTTSHTPGALYKVLSCLNAANINIVKLESRPIPDTDFDFRFYFDFEESVYSDTFVRTMRELEGVCKEFRYYGSYIEI